MPRNPRSFIKTPYFHIITQGINRSYIFENGKDIDYYICKMQELSEEQKINIIAYCIMNNHAHMLLETEDLKELSKYMQRLNTSYGKYYNKKYNRVGYVFRDRYKAEGIYSERQMYNCIKYIYNNPVKAGICEEASEYLYSNYKEVNINTVSNDEYVFLEVDEDIEKTCKHIIKNFCNDNNMKIQEIKSNKIKLKELINILKSEYNISFRRIAKEIGINRETIRQIYNK